MITNFNNFVNESLTGSFLVTHFALQNTKFGNEKGKVQKTRPHSSPDPSCGREISRGRAIHSPRQIVSPCRVRISSFNHLDFARNNFELCPEHTAKKRNRVRMQKYGRHEVPSVLNSPQKVLNPKGFATQSVAPR